MRLRFALLVLATIPALAACDSYYDDYGYGHGFGGGCRSATAAATTIPGTIPIGTIIRPTPIGAGTTASIIPAPASSSTISGGARFAGTTVIAASGWTGARTGTAAATGTAAPTGATIGAISAATGAATMTAAGTGAAGPEPVAPQPAGRRRISTIEVKRSTGSPCWLLTVVWVLNEPISGLLRDGVFSMTLPRTCRVSPG